MSYDIFYRKCFVKVDDKHVIPMVEIGSNNVWEATGKARGKERRARDWNNIEFGRTFNSIIVSNEQLLANIDRIRESEIDKTKDRTEESDKYSDNRFGYFTAMALYGRSTRGTTFGQFKGFYKAGIAGAMTIEELKEHGISLSLAPSYFAKEQAEKAGLEMKPSVTFVSTEQMLAVVKEYTEYYKNSGVNLWCTLNGDYNIDWLEKQRKIARKKAKTPKVGKEVSEYYVIHTGKGYFIKNTKYGYKYSHYSDSYLNKRLETEKKAESFLAKLKKRHVKTEAFKVVKVTIHPSEKKVLL